MENNTLLYQGIVIDNEDPMMLGRVRARFQNPPSDMGSYDDIIKSIKNPPWNEEKDKWTPRDPFVFTPLMPYFIYQVPKNEELIQLMYLNKDYKFQNQYYIQSNFSTPTASKFEYNQGGNKFTGLGTQFVAPKPLKNQDGTYTDSAIHKGVFPEPGDNGLLGRGSADVIVKENEVLVRAGKFRGTSLEPNVIPVGNSQRGFLQLSRFNLTKVKQPDKVITQINDEVVSVKYLIEWVITNPENTQEKFTGTVYLYKLKNDLSTNSKNLTVGSIVKENLKSLVASETFSLLSKSEVVAFINNFIQTCNSSNKTKSGIQLFTEPNNKFPIFYRPNNLTYNILKSSVPPTPTYNQNYYSIGNKTCTGLAPIVNCNITIQVIDAAKGTVVAAGTADGNQNLLNELYQSVVSQVTNSLISQKIEDVLLPTVDELNGSTIIAPTTISVAESTASFKNVTEVYNQIKLLPALKIPGYGLIYAQDKVGIPTSFKSTIVPQSKSFADPTTYGALASDYLYLLSHNSSIPGKGKINFDNTLYGINLDQFVDEILPKTSSLVRGEELLELINMIVRFLTTHTHAYPGLPPVPVTQDGSNVADMLTEIQNAYTKILNNNIRLN
jgi:hypothetical protein